MAADADGADREVMANSTAIRTATSTATSTARGSAKGATTDRARGPAKGSAALLGRPAARPRDQVLDLVRAGSLVIVVLWHWVFTTMIWKTDGPHVGNPVNRTPGMWALTWLLQVMPLFFVVGGALHSMDDTPGGAFIRKRLRRLVRPVLPLMLPAVAIWAAMVWTGQTAAARTVVLIVSPMWFLVVYVVLILLVPAARRLQAALGPWAAVPLALAVAVIDLLRFGQPWEDSLWMIALLMVLTWGTVHQIGFSLPRLRRNRSAAAALAACGLAGLLVLSTWGPYPRPMVGVPGQDVSNMSPPNLMVVCLALLQLGLLGLLWGRLAGLAKRSADLLRVANKWTMTVFTWHLLAFAVFWGLLMAAGAHVPATPEASWWLQRPLWLLGPLAVAVPLCAAVARFDPAARTAPARTGGARSVPVRTGSAAGHTPLEVPHMSSTVRIGTADKSSPLGPPTDHDVGTSNTVCRPHARGLAATVRLP